MWTAFWITAALLIALGPFVIGSLTICAPKWWRRTFPSRAPTVSKWDIMTEKHKKQEARKERITVFWEKERGGPPIIWIAILPIFAVVIVGYFGKYWYIYSVALIERKCPYTNEYTMYAQHTYEHTDSPWKWIIHMWRQLVNDFWR